MNQNQTCWSRLDNTEADITDAEMLAAVTHEDRVEAVLSYPIHPQLITKEPK